MRCLSMMRGGGETSHLAWMRELKKLGVEIEVISGRPLLAEAVYPPEPDLETVTLRSPYMRDFVYRVQTKRGFGRLSTWSLHADEDLFCKLAFAQIAREPRQPDLVLAHALHQAPRFSTGQWPVAVYLVGLPNARYIADLQAADALISDGWSATHLPAVVGRPVIDVPKGVDVDLFTPDGPNVRESMGLAGKRVVMCVARLVPIKNLHVLIQAIATARTTDPDIELVIVGEGPERAALEARAATFGISDAVHFAGYVPQAETPAWYRTADVFALSSDFDNSPNVILEAMASGLPIVATDVGGLRDYVTPPEAGTLTPPRDAAAFATALLDWLSNRERASAAGARNREDAVRRFSWRASAAHMHAVYRDVIAQFAERHAVAS